MKVIFKDALLQADEKDAYTGEAKGDFWGLPSSFKGSSILSYAGSGECKG
jgi:hypothetical protein